MTRYFKSIGALAGMTLATNLMSQAFVLYSIGIMPQGLNVYLNRVYFAAKETKTPMKIGVASAIIHIFLCWILVETMGNLGIAAATTLYAFYYSFLLVVNLKKIIKIQLRKFLFIWRPLLAGALIAVTYSCWDLDGGFTNLLRAATAGSFLYLCALIVMKEPIMKLILSNK